MIYHCWKVTLVLVAAWTGACFAAGAQEEPELLFYLPFDGQTNARVAAGNPAPAVVNGPGRFDTGRFGQALLCGDGETLLSFESEGNIDLHSGTIAFWVKGLNWSPNSGRGHPNVFFEWGNEGDEPWVLFYRIIGHHSVLLRCQSDATHAGAVGVATGRGTTPPWYPGEWHHLCGSWKDGEMRIYLDGVLYDSVRDVPAPEGIDGLFKVGDQTWNQPQLGDPRNAQTLLDEFRIYDAPLPEDQVQLLAQGPRPEVAASDNGQILNLRIELGPLADLVDQPNGKVELRRKSDGVVGLSKAIEAIGAQESMHQLDASGLPFGRYEVMFQLFDGDNEVFPKSATPWFNAQSPQLELSNERLSLTFDGDTGDLLQLADKRSGKNARKVTVGIPLFRIKAVSWAEHAQQCDEEDVFELVPGNDTIQRCEVFEEAGETRLEADYSFSAYDVAVRCRLRLPEGSDIAECSIEVENGTYIKPLEAASLQWLVFPEIPDLALGGQLGDDTLTWPMVQGYLDHHPQTELRGYYCNQLSMGWLDLYDSDCGLYVAVNTEDYPETGIHVTPNLKDDTVQLSFKTWLDMWPGEPSKTLTFAIGIHQGDWHWAADRYREWYDTWSEIAPLPEWAKGTHGFGNQSCHAWRFRDLPGMAESGRKQGTDYVQLWNEMLGGEKTYYSYLYPNPLGGTEVEARENIRRVREEGSHIGFYHNLVTWDAGANHFFWPPNEMNRYESRMPEDFDLPDAWKNDWPNWGVRLPDGSAPFHGEGANGMVAMIDACAGCTAYQDYVLHWVVDKWIRDYGCDAWYFDSVPYWWEEPVCHNLMHGHARPQTINDALIDFYARFDEAVSDLDVLYYTEEPGDLLLPFTRAFLGMDVGKHVPSGTTPRPEIFNYTFPEATFFTRDGDNIPKIVPGLSKDPADAPLYAHLMGERHWGYPPLGECDEHGMTIGFNDPDEDPYYVLRNRFAEELYAARFRDKVGLGPLPEGVHARVFHNPDNGNTVVTILDLRGTFEPWVLELDEALYGPVAASTATLHTLSKSGRVTVTQADQTILVTVDRMDGRAAAVVLQGQ